MSKGVRKYNWEKLKAEFLSGEWLTIRSFLKDKGMPIVYYPQTVGWVKEKKKFQKEALMASTQQILKEDITNLTNVRLRQARLARFLQLKGLAKLKEMSPETVDDARKLVVSGLQEERRALGIEYTGKGGQNLTQINIKLPKTNLDKMIEKMSYEEVLTVIAELKRLGAGRSVSKTTNSSPGEVEEGKVE